jgi:hypothetical protein
MVLRLAREYRPAATNALLIELGLRAGALPSAVSANNLVVVGDLDGGGASGDGHVAVGYQDTANFRQGSSWSWGPAW